EEIAGPTCPLADRSSDVPHEVNHVQDTQNLAGVRVRVVNNVVTDHAVPLHPRVAHHRVNPLLAVALLLSPPGPHAQDAIAGYGGGERLDCAVDGRQVAGMRPGGQLLEPVVAVLPEIGRAHV